MFKSVFAKYVTAVMSIFAVGFLVLLIVLTSIVGNSLTEQKSQTMQDMGEAAEGYLTSFAADCPPEHFAMSLEQAFSTPASKLSALLTALTATDSDLNILIADADGNIRHRICHGAGERVLDSRLPQSLTDNKQDAVFGVTEMDLFPSNVLVRSRAIFNVRGQHIGYAVISSTMAPNGRMMQDLTKTALSSALLVLLAVMIAVYFISERVTDPLRQMSVAAKKFANGNFDTRVAVQGRDEVAQLAIAFNHMADSLENLEKMRRSFVANVSHDLRTPMTTIAGFIDGIRDGVIPPQEQDHYLEVISMEVQRLSRLVSSLLDLSRIQAGDRKFSSETFDICEMGRLILISFEKKLEEKRLNVSFECEQEHMTVYADHDAVYQVFYNICHNAVKFSTEGGDYRIRMTDLDRKVQVSVFNNGQGIPQEDLPYVFERFYKSDKSRGLDKSGVGLGLYISKTIIEAHGEKIWVNSEEGRFCEFSFTLPKPLSGLEKKALSHD